jgi:hypothetical protein
VSTALSWTSPVAKWRRAARDVGPLLRFRAAGVRGRGRTAIIAAFGLIVVLTLLAAWLPAYLPGSHARRSDLLLLLPTGYISVLVISIVSAAASGGGRELLPREQAVAFPISPITDHLGALMMAPLNIAWLLQSWALLGATAYVIGPHWQLIMAQAPVLVWLVTATSIAQLMAWAMEWLRRGARGTVVVRSLILVVGLAMAALVATGKLLPLLDHSPTIRITLGVVYGGAGEVLPWLKVVVVLLAMAATAIVLGGLAASAVVRRPARDELRVESSIHTPRTNPATGFAALLRTDRVGIWRSVPLRRGLAVLAILPGLVAAAGSLQWEMLSILPGLVASGGVLLFGVNSWCMDGRGALWRDSLPAPPKQVFASRVVVLVEVLLLASLLAVVLASLSAGVPTVSQLLAVICDALVVTLQVVAAAIRWSVRRPFAADMRSARATPAPPLVMVGYSARLALTTTMTGLLFSLATHASWQIPLLVALPFVLFSAAKLVGTANEWANPEIRSRVIATVAS